MCVCGVYVTLSPSRDGACERPLVIIRVHYYSKNAYFRLTSAIGYSALCMAGAVRDNCSGDSGSVSDAVVVSCDTDMKAVAIAEKFAAKSKYKHLV